MRCPVHVGAAGTGTKLVSRAQVTGVFCNMAIESARADKDLSECEHVNKIRSRCRGSGSHLHMRADS